MKKLIILIIVMLLLGSIAVTASSADDAKKAWLDAKKDSIDKQADHRNAKLDYNADPTPENEEAVIDTGKEVLHAALDEAEAWLEWKQAEVEENDEVPDDLRDTILDDVATNLGTIEDLRAEVDGVTNRFELGVVFLKMIGKYFDLLTDVSRNSGLVWVHLGEKRADTIEQYEEKLRNAAEGLDNEDDIMQHLEWSHEELVKARETLQNANSAYEQVRQGGTPLIKFAEGNNYLRTARMQLLAAHQHLVHAFVKIQTGGQ